MREEWMVFQVGSTDSSSNMSSCTSSRASSPLQLAASYSSSSLDSVTISEVDETCEHLFFSDPKNAERIGAALARSAWAQMAEAEEKGDLSPEKIVVASIEQIVKCNNSLRKNQQDAYIWDQNKWMNAWDGASVCRLVDGMFAPVLAHAMYLQDSQYINELLTIRRRLCCEVAASQILSRNEVIM